MKITKLSPAYSAALADTTTLGTAAGGDTSGSLPNPTVVGIQGTPVDPLPSDPTEYLNGSGHWTTPSGVAGTIVVEDEGSPLTTPADTLNFVGGGVTASGTGGTKTITIPGSSTTIVRPSLTPATPTDDFTVASISSWTGVSTFGTFNAADCFGGALDGSHLWMAYNASDGFLYLPASNVDQEWIAGGVLCGLSNVQDIFFGIALLDSSNNGVGVIFHHGDTTLAIITITAGVYDSTTAHTTTFNYGWAVNGVIPIALRLTRVGNVFDGYASVTGSTWEGHVSATITRTITASRKCIGVFGGVSGATGVMTADWVDTV